MKKETKEELKDIATNIIVAACVFIVAGIIFTITR